MRPNRIYLPFVPKSVSIRYAGQKSCGKNLHPVGVWRQRSGCLQFAPPLNVRRYHVSSVLGISPPGWLFARHADRRRRTLPPVRMRANACTWRKTLRSSLRKGSTSRGSYSRNVRRTASVCTCTGYVSFALIPYSQSFRVQKYCFLPTYPNFFVILSLFALFCIFSALKQGQLHGLF